MESALNLKWFSEWTNKKKSDKNHAVSKLGLETEL